MFNYKTILLDLIKLNSNNLGRKPSFDFEHYLDVIIYVLASGISWTYLDKELHYSTYYKKFRYWSKLNIFQEAFDIINQLNNDNKNNKLFTENLFMDSTDILNKSAFQDIGKSHKYKYKNATKINVVINNLGMPLGIKIVSANIHDTSITLDTINNISYKVLLPKNMIGDKGYISKSNKNTLKKKNINLVYPLRKNSKDIKSYAYKHLSKPLLKDRYINENFFSWFKAIKRLTDRYDRITETFSSFVHLRLIQILEIKINKFKLF